MRCSSQKTGVLRPCCRGCREEEGARGAELAVSHVDGDRPTEDAHDHVEATVSERAARKRVALEGLVQQADETCCSTHACGMATSISATASPASGRQGGRVGAGDAY